MSGTAERRGPDLEARDSLVVGGDVVRRKFDESVEVRVVAVDVQSYGSFSLGFDQTLMRPPSPKGKDGKFSSAVLFRTSATGQAVP